MFIQVVSDCRQVAVTRRSGATRKRVTRRTRALQGGTEDFSPIHSPPPPPHPPTPSYGAVKGQGKEKDKEVHPAFHLVFIKKEPAKTRGPLLSLSGNPIVHNRFDNPNSNYPTGSPCLYCTLYCILLCIPAESEVWIGG